MARVLLADAGSSSLRLVVVSDDPMEDDLTCTQHAPHIRMAQSASKSEVALLLKGLDGRGPCLDGHAVQRFERHVEAVAAVDRHGPAGSKLMYVGTTPAVKRSISAPERS